MNSWASVDGYICDLLVESDPALEAALEASREAGLPAINANQGKMLQLLARMQGARTILELGTLGGDSTIWLAGALQAGGRLVTLEADPAHAAVARANLSAAGLQEVVEVRLGPALDMLPQLAAEGLGPSSDTSACRGADVRQQGGGHPRPEVSACRGADVR